MKKFTLWSKNYLLSLSFLLAFGLMSCQDNGLEPSDSGIEATPKLQFTTADQQELSKFKVITINGEVTTDLALVFSELNHAYQSVFDYNGDNQELAIFLTKEDYEDAVDNDPKWKRFDEEGKVSQEDEDGNFGLLKLGATENEVSDDNGNQRVQADHTTHNYDDLSNHAVISRQYTSGSFYTYRVGHLRSTRDATVNTFKYHYSSSSYTPNVIDVNNTHSFILGNMASSGIVTDLRNTRDDRRYYRFRFWSGKDFTGSTKTIRIYPNTDIQLTTSNCYPNGTTPLSVQRNSYTY